MLSVSITESDLFRNDLSPWAVISFNRSSLALQGSNTLGTNVDSENFSSGKPKASFNIL